MGDIAFFALFFAPTVLYLIRTGFSPKYDILLIGVVNVFFLLATGVVWEKLVPGGSVAMPLLVMWLGLMVAVWVSTGTHRLKNTRAAELEAEARETADSADKKDRKQGGAD